MHTPYPLLQLSVTWVVLWIFFFLASAHGEDVRYLDLYIFWERSKEAQGPPLSSPEANKLQRASGVSLFS